MPYLKVDFPNGYSTTYILPVPNVCVDITSCPHWGPAGAISWSHIPSANRAIFSEDDRCSRTSGYFFRTADGHHTGSYRFNTEQIIKSMMLIQDNYMVTTLIPPISKYECTPTHEDAVVDDNETVANTTADSSSLGWATSTWFGESQCNDTLN